MTAEEAAQVAEIIGTADGGCHVCVGSLADQLIESFPEHTEVWRTKSGLSWYEDDE